VSLLQLEESNTKSYLARRGIGAHNVLPLGGGVSNMVILADTTSGRMVLKQALARLKVQEEWLSDPRRTVRECAAIRLLAPHLPPGAVPEILFEDAENCIYAMSAAPPESFDWKTLLLRGEVRPPVAAAIARILAAMIHATWMSAEWDERFGDQTVFGQLRLEPYYRFTASRHPDLAARFERLIATCAGRRRSLVHGDYSPKNFLVSGDSAMAIDFEVVHFGDPSFDAAFLLNHLRLKMFYRPEWAKQYAVAAMTFWNELRPSLPPETEWFEASAIAHLGGLMLARIDGKSPAEYIATEELRGRVRRYARELMLHPPAAMEEIFK
jgi:5-methylthioribose kinase